MYVTASVHTSHALATDCWENALLSKCMTWHLKRSIFPDVSIRTMYQELIGLILDCYQKIYCHFTHCTHEFHSLEKEYYGSAENFRLLSNFTLARGFTRYSSNTLYFHTLHILRVPDILLFMIYWFDIGFWAADWAEIHAHYNGMTLSFRYGCFWLPEPRYRLAF